MLPALILPALLSFYLITPLLCFTTLLPFTLFKMSTLIPVSSSTNSLVSQFREKKAFREIQELAFLSYYKDFKLLLCSSCSCSIFPFITTFKSHLLQDLKLVPLDLQKIIITQALDIFQSLEVSSYKKSLELLKSFSLYSSLLVFKELKLLDLYRC